MDPQRQERRKQDFKKSFVKQEEKGKRRDEANKISKEKREKIISSKRIKLEEGESSWTNEQLTHVLSSLHSSDPQIKQSALSNLRQILSCNNEAPIQQTIEGGAIPILMQFLGDGSNKQGVLDATWCFTNLAYGNQAQTEVTLPAVPYLISFLSSGDPQLQEQSSWGLANIAAESIQFRDHLRGLGAVPPLISLLRSTHNNTLIQTASFALSNLARGANPNLKELFDCGIASIIEVLIQSRDIRVLIEVAWLLTYLTVGEEQYIITLADHGIFPFLLHHLSSPPDISQLEVDIFNLTPVSTHHLFIPILRALGNFISCSGDIADRIIRLEHNSPLLRILFNTLKSEHRAVRKESAYVLSNIAAYAPYRSELVVSGFLPALVDMLTHQPYDIKKEAGFAISNISVDSSQIPLILDCNAMPGFLNFLASPDTEVIILGLNFIEGVLTKCPQRGVSIIEENEGVDKIDTLSYHSNDRICRQASYLLDTYFYDEESSINNYEEADSPIDQMPPWRIAAQQKYQQQTQPQSQYPAHLFNFHTPSN